MSHTLIYIPSYFDYVRLRNYMKREEIRFASICEYCSRSEVSRARHFFQRGDKQFVLFTERFHFYKRSVFGERAHPERVLGLILNRTLNPDLVQPQILNWESNIPVTKYTHVDLNNVDKTNNLSLYISKKQRKMILLFFRFSSLNFSKR